MSRIVFALLCLMTSPAAALTCEPHDAMRNYLKREYGQEVVRKGEVNAQPPRFMEMYFNPQFGSWTITMTGIEGGSCVFSTGVRLVALAPGVPT